MRLWRYTDLPKFVDLLTSRQLWLSNAEALAVDDPYEGWPGPIRFPHRVWRCIEDVPKNLQTQILRMCSLGTDGSPQAAFRSWFMHEEQHCFMTQSGRRQYYVNCWHAAKDESIAMWKIYGSPGAGVAIISNGARLETALACNTQDLYLGTVKYQDRDIVQIGASNAFDTLMIKRISYSYEQEVRLVFWDIDPASFHDPLENFSWNEEKMRFENLVDDPRPLIPGLSLQCDVSVLIERVIISPFAPSWYLSMIERLRDQLDLHFPVIASTLLAAPKTIS